MASLVEVLRVDLRFVMFNSIISPFSKVRLGNSRCMSMFTSSRPEETKQRKDEVEDNSEFRKLNIRGEGQDRVRRGRGRAAPYKPTVLPPRYTGMAVDQDWPSVWPTAQTFKASVVPLPLRQGLNEKDAPPAKYGNAELMKIPNFLHLTPPAIKRHCTAIKKFCTPWPSELTDDEKCERHFPVSVTTNDYLYSGPSVREPKARIVTIKLKLSQLELNAHARDKLLRLVGDRYDQTTGDLTFVTDRCPLRKQNYDYAMYLLTAVYFESWKTEPWESEKDEEDAECYDWNKSKSKSASIDLLRRMKEAPAEKPSYLNHLSDQFNEDDLLKLDEVKSYSKAVTVIHNEGEDMITLNEYKQSVLKLLNLNSPPAAAAVS